MSLEQTEVVMSGQNLGHKISKCFHYKGKSETPGNLFGIYAFTQVTLMVRRETLTQQTGQEDNGNVDEQQKITHDDTAKLLPSEENIKVETIDCPP